MRIVGWIVTCCFGLFILIVLAGGPAQTVPMAPKSERDRFCNLPYETKELVVAMKHREHLDAGKSYVSLSTYRDAWRMHYGC